MDSKPDFFSTMPSKPSFFFGLVSGVAVISILGLLLTLSGALPTSRGPSAVAGSPIAAAPSAPTPSAPAPLPPAGDPPPVTDADHIRGNKDAKVTLIEYSDFECPFCQRFHPTMQQALQEFDGKVRWVYRHYPLPFHDPLATKQAEAVECANELAGNDSFWTFSDKIFETTRSNGNGMTVDQLYGIARDLKLDEAKFKTCLDGGKYRQHIQDEMAAGSAAGISGTPGTFLIDENGNAQLISGAQPYETVKAMIDAVLQ